MIVDGVPLPDTHKAALEFYADRLEVAAKRGVEFQRKTQAFLGRIDLFFLLVKLLRRPDLNKAWLFDRCREVQASPDSHLDLWAREHGKDLATSTPVLTANRGWATHGDLAPGDLVFAPDGRERAVLAVTEHYSDNPCYLLTFSDGARIIAGAGHLWRLRKKIKRRVPGTWRLGHFRRTEFIDVVTSTKYMALIGGRLDVGVCEPLVFSEAELPLDPYVLGAWLGDGNTNGVRITAGHEDADYMEDALSACGIEVTRVMHSNAVTLRLGRGVRGNRLSSDVANVLRRLGVMGNKHIPIAYMRGSTEQRMALLQGLMDTDGTCNTRGTATFCQSKLELAQQVYDLVASLGLQPRIYRRVSAEYGTPFWQVNFQSHQDRNPFRMPRKAARAIPVSHYRGVRTVAKIEAMPSVPTNCITVEDGLYCVGRELIPTHNSSIITFGLTIQDIMNDPEITVGIFSHTRPIAKTFLRQIKVEFEGNEWLKHLYPDVLYEQPHKQSPKWSEDDGITVRRRGNPKEASIEAWGLVDGQPTGRHFKLRVYDDVVTRESVTTAEQIEKTTRAWELSDNLGVQADHGGRARYIGTRYSLYDSYSAILARKAATPRLYPATHNGRFDGRPVLFSEATWQDKLRTQGRTTVASQLLQNPMADEGATFRTQWLKAYEVRPRTLNVYIMADPSRGRTARSDNTAMAVIGVGAGGAKYLLDGLCHRMTSLSDRWQNLRMLYHRWSGMRGVQHIEVGYERFGMQSDCEYFEEQMELEAKRRIPGAHFVIQELAWPREGGNSKQDRVGRLEPDFRNGRFYLPLQVMHEGKPHRWRVDTDPGSARFGEVELFEGGGLTRLQMDAIEGGSGDLVGKPIICRDPALPGPRGTGGRYDLTMRFMDEYQTFPFGMHDDLVDAASRVYDMDPHTPMAPGRGSSSPPQSFVDGV